MDKFNTILEEDARHVAEKVDLKELLGKKIIITGASGMIGINFLMSLKEFSAQHDGEKAPEVTAIFYSDIPAYFKNVLQAKNIIIKTGDITDPAFVESLPEADYIIHAAGYAQPGKFLQDKIKTISINTSATIYLLKKLKSDGKFLFVSSSEIYSGLSNAPFTENQIGTTNTLHPRACYIEGKRCGEVICNSYFEKGIKVKSARLSLAYGPGTKSGDMRVLNSFIEKALKGNITMMDMGESKRTYLYVRDAVEIMWKILLSGTEPIYNVGGTSRTTIGELATIIGDYMKVPVTFPEKSATLAGAPDDVYLDMSKVEKEFNIKEFVSLEEGLKRTVEWQRELYKK